VVVVMEKVVCLRRMGPISRVCVCVCVYAHWCVPV
jgi:hypothetical protein